MGDSEFSVRYKRLAQLRAYAKRSERQKEQGKAVRDNVRDRSPPEEIGPKSLGSTRSTPSLHDYNIGARGVPLFGGRFKAPPKVEKSWWNNPPVDPSTTCRPVHSRLAVPKTVARAEDISPFFKDSHAYEDAQFMKNLRTYRKGEYPGKYL